MLRPVERFTEQLSSLGSVDDTNASLNAIEWMHAKPFTNSRKTSLSLCRLWATCVIVLIVCTPMETDRSNSFVERAKRVCILCVVYKGDSSATDGSDVTISYRSSTFATQSLVGTCDAADSGTKFFLDVFFAACSTVQKIHWRQLGHVHVSMV